MSTRALKRAQKTRQRECSNSGSDEECTPSAPASNLFALLNASDEDDGEEEHRTYPAARDPDIERDPADAPTDKASSDKALSRKNNKKKKGKAPAGETVDGEDEIDAALRALKTEHGIEVTMRSESSAAKVRDALVSALEADPKHLNPELELRRLFGKEALAADRKPAKGRQRLRREKGFLVTPRDTWPPVMDEGLTMEFVDAREGCDYFQYVYKPDYEQTQREFEQCVETHDPETIFFLYRMHPYHTDTVFQVSEIRRQHGELQEAAELIEMALHALERTFHSAFRLEQGAFFATGKFGCVETRPRVNAATCRLPYARRENRGFFLVLFKHMQNLERKGCPRTALECCKVLLTHDLENDPVGALLYMDYLALRSQEFGFLLHLQSILASRRLWTLPNWAYSLAFAAMKVESPDAPALMERALLMFPGVVPKLLEKCDAHWDSGLAFFSTARALPSIELLATLYAERAYGLWKEPEVLAWLKLNCTAAQEKVRARDPIVAEFAGLARAGYEGQPPLNVCRHVVLSDFAKVMALLPPERMTVAIRAYDPFPPEGSPPPAAPAGADVNALVSFLQSLLPWNSVGGPS